MRNMSAAALSFYGFPRQFLRSLSSVYSTLTTSMPEISQMDPKISSYEQLHRFSVENPDRFWGVLARNRISWMRDFDRVSDCHMESGKIRWFVDGKLNVSVNCVDRHMKKNPNKVAFIWEKDEPNQTETVTYRQLYELMNRLANLMRSVGVKKGDRVVLYVPVCPMAAAAMLACARVGAVHSVVFAGFSSEALASRIQDAGAEIVITMDRSTRGGKSIELKRIVDSAVAKCPLVRHVLVGRRTGGSVPMSKIDIEIDKELGAQPVDCEPEELDSEDPLYMLYTSGSTGAPKGVVHTQAGYLLYTSVTQQHVFEYEAEDLFGCVADVGWITGHSHVVYGPLCNGGTSLLFESTPVYPDPGRYWSVVEKLKLTHFYSSPTALRTLLRFGDHWVNKYDRSSLRILGTVGEPMNRDAWNWYHNVVGEQKCTIIDTWWQTETGGVSIAPRPSAPDAEVKPAMPMRPMFGIEPVLLDERGDELTGNNVSGILCLKGCWPSVARTLYGNHARFLETYLKPYPGYYFTGDGAHRDGDGHYVITGRLDDVINVSGHRVGTAEIEQVMAECGSVAETAVVGFPHEIKGEGIYAYVVLKEYVGDESEEVTADVKALVRRRIAGYAVPDVVQICTAFPKTRSGKVMRRILRKIAANQLQDLGDVSTLAEPQVVDQIIEGKRMLLEKGNRLEKEMKSRS